MPDNSINPYLYAGNQKIQLLFLIPSLSTGGAEIQLINLIKGLDRSRFCVHVVTLYSSLGCSKMLRELDIEYLELEKRHALDFRFILPLHFWIRRHRIDIIHGINVSARFFAWILGRMNRCKVVVSERNSQPVYSSAGSRLYHAIEHFTNRKADWIVANSLAGKRFAESLGVPSKLTSMIPNGIDLDRLKSNGLARQFKQEIGLNINSSVVGMIARLFPQKDHQTFLKAAEIVASKRNNCYFILVGDGPERDDLEQLTRRLSLDDRVIFAGNQSRIGDWLQIIDVVVLTSKQSEGCPNSIIEAMSMAKPVILTHVDGNREWITDRHNGILIPPQHPEILAQELTHLLDSPEKQQMLARNAKEYAQQKFSLSAMISSYENGYTKLLIMDSKRGAEVNQEQTLPQRRVHMFGVPVDACDLEGCVDWINSQIRQNTTRHIVLVNAAKLVKAQWDEELAAIIRKADLVGADGVPVVWVSKIFGNPLPGRLNGTDLMYRIFELSVQKGYRLYLLGARTQVIQKAVDRLRQMYPGIQIAGYRCGYFNDEQEIDSAILEIAESETDVLLVGMSSPMKEKFVRQYIDRFHVKVIHGVGGSFDILGGLTRRAPVWMQNYGLEWFYRLCQEPKRLWKRYLVLNSLFIGMTLKEGFKRVASRGNRIAH
ncbi:WecB/TagA/CpsF family glycosyltransferase [candidate division KSB1 bacterium]|nr:WecB/TagA/CpsF family glycosyltransferase [candidate division KSB1 bacterium]